MDFRATVFWVCFFFISFCAGSFYISEKSEFLADYYKENPISCLEEVYSMRDFNFDKIFISDISYRFAKFLHYLPLRLRRSYDNMEICEKIRWIIHDHLFEAYNSESEKEKNFEIIKLLISIIKRISNAFYRRGPPIVSTCGN